MKIVYTVENIEDAGLDKVYTVKLRIVETGDETEMMVNVPPGMDLKSMLKDVLLTDEEVVFVEGT